MLSSIEEKTIADYLNISLFDVLKLNILEFKFYLREAFIFNCSKTEEGLEYLKNAKRIETTDIDRTKLRETFGSNRK